MRQYEDLLIDVLLDRGFSVEEAEKLIRLQERYEREWLEAQRIRWLGRGFSQPDLRSIRDLYN
jgi:hypothetical protein